MSGPYRGAPHPDGSLFGGTPPGGTHSGGTLAGEALPDGAGPDPAGTDTAHTGAVSPGAAAPGGTDAGGDADGRPRRRVELDPDTVERDLARLVLTVIELLRQLMERQALRRVEGGDLSEEQEERIGTTLMLLEDRMEILRTRFGLEPEDLNIDLGPLGSLL